MFRLNCFANWEKQSVLIGKSKDADTSAARPCLIYVSTPQCVNVRQMSYQVLAANYLGAKDKPPKYDHQSFSNPDLLASHRLSSQRMQTSGLSVRSSHKVLFKNMCRLLFSFRPACPKPYLLFDSTGLPDQEASALLSTKTRPMKEETILALPTIDQDLHSKSHDLSQSDDARPINCSHPSKRLPETS